MSKSPTSEFKSAAGGVMIRVPAGSFIMGSPESEDGHRVWEQQREVTFVNDFYLGQTPVTQEQYEVVTGTNPTDHEVIRNAPVDSVNWGQANEYCQKLTSLDREAGVLPDGWEYRLPTEAEWEYAARGGLKSENHKYSGSNDITKVAWFNHNSDKTTHVVASKQSNELGLYDMTGNVWEWCLDWYDKNYYKNSPELNPENTVKNERQRKVVRGGAWSDFDSFSFINFRNSCKPLDTLNLVGFRVVKL